VHYHIPTDKAIADQAANLILADLSIVYSVQALADKCGVTAYTLKRIFRSCRGMSIAAFSRTARIERAKLLLRETNNTLQMIAEETGYTEGNNFQYAFKQMVGCTPGEFRRRGGGE
jgi:two-component system, response regulator YesN